MSKATTKKQTEGKQGVLVDVKTYARNIWLAGLGVYSKAGQEGADYFNDLVKAGEAVEKKGKQLVDTQVEAANSQVASVKNSVTGVKEKVEVKLEKIEEGFDSRVAGALNRLGFPAQKDIAVLSNKLDQLMNLVEQAARSK